MIRICLVLFFLASCQAAFSQVDVYIKITDHNDKVIEGESQSQAFPKYIEAYATSNTVENCASGMCKSSVREVTFQLNLDKSLIALRKEFFLANQLKKVEVFYVKPGAQGPKSPAFYRLVLGSAFITSFQETAGADNSPKVQITFAPGQIGWGYKTQKPDGSFDTEIRAGWDIAKNVEWSSF